MDMLQHAVIHSLNKSAGQGVAATKRMAPELLDVSNETLVSLAAQIAGVIGKNENRLIWGQFASGNREGLFPAATQRLLQDNVGDTFMEMSATAMDELTAFAEKSNFATGGYICFLRYTSRSSDYVLIAMVKERGAFTVDKNLVPTAIVEIDLGKLHQAARINLTSFAAVCGSGQGGPGLDEDDERDVGYLCFVNNRASEVAAYFQEALGCKPGITAARATRKVIDEVKRFVEKNSEISGYRFEAKRAVVEYLATRANQDVVELTTILQVVKNCLPAEKACIVDELPEWLNSEDIQIPHQFRVHAATVKRCTRIKASGPGKRWELSFEDGVLGEKDGEILYNRDSRSLTITSLEDSDVSRIEQSLRERGLAEGR